jgi:hypothetical protein
VFLSWNLILPDALIKFRPVLLHRWFVGRSVILVVRRCEKLYYNSYNEAGSFLISYDL